MAREKIVVDLMPGRNELKKAISGIGSTINTIGLAVSGILAGAAIKNVIEIANQQEDAVNRLNASLKVAGDFSEEASKSFQDFAAEIERTTVFGDELVLSNLALAKSFGATNEQAKEILSAAVDLSAAFDIDLESAVRNTAKTLSGLSGELGESIPALKELGSESLKAGEGVKLIGDRFRGAAIEQVKTFSGGIKQAKNSLGTFFEEIGKLITQNPAVIEALKTTATIFNNVAAAVKLNADAFKEAIATGVLGLVQFLQPVTAAFSVISEIGGKVLGTVGLIIKRIGGIPKGLGRQFDIITTNFDLFITNVAKFLQDIKIEVLDTISASVNGVIAVFNQAKKALGFGKKTGFIEVFDFKKEQAVSKALTKNAGILQDKLLSLESTFIDVFDEGDNAIANTGDSMFKLGEIFTDVFSNIETTTLVQLEQKLKNLLKSFSKEAKKAKDDARKDDNRNNNIKIAFENLNDATNKIAENFAKFSQDLIGKSNEIVSFFQGKGPLSEQTLKFATDTSKALLVGIQQGAEGARNIIGQVVTGLGEKLLPGIGGVLGEAFKLLSLPPEEFRKVIIEFIKAIPQIILNVFENAADFGIVLAEATIDALQGFFDRLPTFIPKIIDRIILGIPRIITKFVQSVPIIISSIASQTGVIVNSFITTLVKEAPAVAKALVDGILELLNPKNIFGGSGGGGLFGGIPIVGDVLGGIGSVFGFAEGGVVPQGFPNDSFPARLSSGEFVIRRDQNEKLDRFLDRELSNNQDTALLNAILVELRRPVTVESNLEIDNRNFGRVILELNRDNERLEA